MPYLDDLVMSPQIRSVIGSEKARTTSKQVLTQINATSLLTEDHSYEGLPELSAYAQALRDSLLAAGLTADDAADVTYELFDRLPDTALSGQTGILRLPEICHIVTGSAESGAAMHELLTTDETEDARQAKAEAWTWLRSRLPHPVSQAPLVVSLHSPVPGSTVADRNFASQVVVGSLPRDGDETYILSEAVQEAVKEVVMIQHQGATSAEEVAAREEMARASQQWLESLILSSRNV